MNWSSSRTSRSWPTASASFDVWAKTAAEIESKAIAALRAFVGDDDELERWTYRWEADAIHDGFGEILDWKASVKAEYYPPG